MDSKHRNSGEPAATLHSDSSTSDQPIPGGQKAAAAIERLISRLPEINEWVEATKRRRGTGEGAKWTP